MSQREQGVLDNPQNANCTSRRSERSDEAAAGTGGLPISIDIPKEEKEESYERRGGDDSGAGGGGDDAERSQWENLEAWISSWGDPIKVFICYLNPMLLSLLGVQFPDESPFTTRQMGMVGFVVASIIYAAALAACNKCSGTIYSPCTDLVLIVVGSFISASLMAVLLPPLATPIVFVIWGIISICILVIARHLIKSLCSSVYNSIKETFHSIGYTKHIDSTCISPLKE